MATSINKKRESIMKSTKKRTAGKQPVQYIFSGTDKRFAKTKTWTINELSEIVGISTSSMKDRISGEKSFTDRDVRPAKKNRGSGFVKSSSEITRGAEISLSSKWLKRKLVTNSSLQ